MRTFAIGDIHGHAALLVEMLRLIEEAARDEPHRVVCLGDYIDRGPDSAEVIELLRRRQGDVGRNRFVCLKGNHEAMLLGARHTAKDELLWMQNGGAGCLRSYGAPSAAELPEADVAWIEECPTYFEDGWRAYVHAGLDPARDRLDQDDDDRLWIRDAFLDGDHDFGRFVVHGHTPQEDGRPDLRRHRLNLDTAAAYGGPLTAAIFVDGRAKPIAFLRADPA